MSDRVKNALLSKLQQAKAVFGQSGQQELNQAQPQFITQQNKGQSTPRAGAESRAVDKLNDLSARLGLDVNDGLVILLATAVFTAMLLLVLWTMIRRY